MTPILLTKDKMRRQQVGQLPQDASVLAAFVQVGHVHPSESSGMLTFGTAYVDDGQVFFNGRVHADGYSLGEIVVLYQLNGTL